MASFKIASLQKQLENTVPSADLEKANREFNSLTEKYRDLLERCNGLVAKNDASTGLDVGINFLAVIYFNILLHSKFYYMMIVKVSTKLGNRSVR